MDVNDIGSLEYARSDFLPGYLDAGDPHQKGGGFLCRYARMILATGCNSALFASWRSLDVSYVVIPYAC